jgi:hypothetical protein
MPHGWSCEASVTLALHFPGGVLQGIDRWEEKSLGEPPCSKRNIYVGYVSYLLRVAGFFQLTCRKTRNPRKTAAKR